MQVGSWTLSTSILLRRCLLSCWVRVVNFTVKGENPWPVWESSYGHRYVSFCDSNNYNGRAFVKLISFPSGLAEISRMLLVIHCIMFWCRFKNEQRRSGETSMQPLNLCDCVWSVTCWKWNAVLLGLTAWMKWAWGALAYIRLFLDWTALFQGLYSKYCMHKVQQLTIILIISWIKKIFPIFSH